MSKDERIAQAVKNIVKRNQERYTMTSYKDVPNTKVPDQHGKPMPDGGIAGEIKVSAGVTVIEGSHAGNSKRGNSNFEEGAERVQMPNNPAPRDGMTQSQVGPRE